MSFVFGEADRERAGTNVHVAGLRSPGLVRLVGGGCQCHRWIIDLYYGRKRWCVLALGALLYL